MPSDDGMAQPARVWRPVTRKKQTGAGVTGGMLWRAAVTRVTPKFYSAQYNDGTEARVHEKHVFLGDPPVAFGQEQLQIQAGEFVEVLEAADDGRAMLGVVLGIKADKSVSVSHPFLATSQQVQANRVRRFRCFLDSEWKLLEPHQKWAAGQVLSPHELATIRECHLGSFVELPQPVDGDTALQLSTSDIHASSRADQLTGQELRGASQRQDKPQLAGQAVEDTRDGKQHGVQQQQPPPPHRSIRTAVIAEADRWDVSPGHVTAGSQPTGLQTGQAGATAAVVTAVGTDVLLEQIKELHLTPVAKAQEQQTQFPVMHSPHVNSAARRGPLQDAARRMPLRPRRAPAPVVTTSYEISPFCDSECSDSPSPRKPVPQWARGPAVLAAVKRQQGVDPDDVFGPMPSCTLDMERVFTTPDLVEPGSDWRDWRDTRGSTGCWRDDRLRTSEKEAYRVTLGYQ